jgi:8-oxo-dGTP diphosphatase
MIDVTCALIVNNGKILVARNSRNSDHPLQWEFPGGKTDAGETAEECIVREIGEELEISVEVLVPLTPVGHDYGFKQIRLIPFICRIVQGGLQLNNHEEAAWIEPNDLKTLDFAEADRALLETGGNFERLKEYLRKQVDNS